MNSVSLEYFRAVVEEMSFSRAAEKCYISQQAISQHVSKLERQYNVTLLQRSPHLALTPAGKLVYDYAARMAYEENRILGQLRDLSDEAAGTVTIGMTANKSSRIIPAVFGAFHERYPRVLLRFVDGATADLKRNFLENEINLMVINSDLQEPGITYREVCEQIILLCASGEVLDRCCEDSRELIARCGETVSLAGFSACPFLLPPAGYRVRRAVDPVFQNLHMEPEIILETSNPHVLEELVRQKAGVALISRDAVSADYLERGAGEGLYHFRLRELQSRGATKIYYHADTYFSPFCLELMDMIEAALNKRPFRGSGR